LKEQILKLIDPIIISMKYELWGLNIGQQNNSLKLTIYIDSKSGININDCEKVSNQVTHILDIENICNGDYILEVSSPGLDRVLMTKEHFAKYINKKVKLKLKWLVKNRKNIVGMIKDVNDNFVVINDKTDIYEIEYDSIDNARLKI
tara:strand:- start:2708 stop:3148 length:441 start_codon:yes stop_codon:yes gene_type:complete